MDWFVPEYLMTFPVGAFSRFCLDLNIDITLVSNGAVFMPNTFTMQEWVRTSFDDYVEGLENGQSASDAAILSVRKGTCSPGYDVKDSI